MKGYLIEYGYGDYDGYTTEVVKCFLDKTKAEEYKEKWNRLYGKWYEYYVELRKAMCGIDEEQENIFYDKWWDRYYALDNYYGNCWIKEIEIL